ncbi:MAG: metal ABC transporter ATP-binding protein [Succinivibrionaceae bacterium]
MNIIECQELSLGYGVIPLFEKLNFSVKKGAFVCIIGANGSGKSSLLRSIIGVKKPLSGSISIDSSVKNIGYLQQQGKLNPVFPATVWEIVLSSCCTTKGEEYSKFFFLKNIFSSAKKNKALHYLEKMNLLPYKNKCFKDLSGGLQQRVLLARALCMESPILCLDEPIGGLDPISRESMYSEISQINKNGTTVLMVSHDIPKAFEYATDVLVVAKKCLYLPVSEFLNSSIGKSFIEVHNTQLC